MEDENNDEQEKENSVLECNVYEGHIEVDYSLEAEFERTAREKHEHFQQGNFIFFIFQFTFFVHFLFSDALSFTYQHKTLHSRNF